MVWPFPTWREIAGMALVILLLGGLATAFLLRQDLFLHANRGFGPDWDCTYPGYGEPICVKRVAPAKNPQ
jgi:hypothetical protein